MITRIIAWSARNLLLVLFGSDFAAAAGIYALAHLLLDAIPNRGKSAHFIAVFTFANRFSEVLFALQSPRCRMLFCSDRGYSLL